ncbi:hypothetical protein RIR_jg28292.t1 [Rhizophagus irregularis DAOM 181602=DAOM 197198]|nr:hypothetical protein RIR_jg28292.t1 [Rhizophagus irregularis DAOM 181602=DAOM 197198]
MKVNDFGNLTGPNNRKWLNIMRYITLEELYFGCPLLGFITFIISATIPYDDGLLWQSWTRINMNYMNCKSTQRLI